jgi:hypothetical protein
MQKELIAQLRAKHRAAAACLTLIEEATDAGMKNTASEWYDSFVIDIVEMQVPESEKPQYYDLDTYNTLMDEMFADDHIAQQQEMARQKVHVTMHEEINVPYNEHYHPVAHNL